MVAAEKLRGERGWYWLSFADEKQFLGGALVRAWGETDAIMECHRLGINPGGQVFVVAVPDEEPPKAEWVNRLLSKSDMDVMGMEPEKVEF